MLIKDIMTNQYQLMNHSDTLDNHYESVYAGDLLSVVMRSASKGCILISVISNLNTIAVAVLLEIPAIIITENQEVSQAMIDRADKESIALIATSLKTHEVIIDLKDRGCL